MSDENNITQPIGGLKDGDQEVARKLWEEYFQKLVRLVVHKLPTRARRVFDEEDVALGAFKSLCFGVAEDRFPDLHDRGNLWAVLVVIATRKTQCYVEAQNRRKRGGGTVRGDSIFLDSEFAGELAGFDAFVGNEPTSTLLAQAEEACEGLLDSLGVETLRTMAILKMQGLTIDSIAAETNLTNRAVQRRLEIIRKTWCEQVPEEGSET